MVVAGRLDGRWVHVEGIEPKEVRLTDKNIEAGADLLREQLGCDPDGLGRRYQVPLHLTRQRWQRWVVTGILDANNAGQSARV